jgi:GGDEF domain-containing protein
VQANVGRFETDNMVRGLTHSMRESFREYDFLGHIGPGEFLLVLPGVSPFAVRTKATKLLQIASGSGLNTVQVLAAEALFPDDGADADQLLAAADRRIFELRGERYSPAPRSLAAQAGWVQ